VNGAGADWVAGYSPGGYYCELLGRPGADAAHTARLRRHLGRIPLAELARRAGEAEHELQVLGVTFTVYSDKDFIDRVLPFDPIPRVLSAAEWRTIESGVKQRVAAMNMFIADAYGPGRVFKDGVVPADLVLGNSNFRPEMREFEVPRGTYIHICGIDIVRDDGGGFMVLEDNGRTPSGVSYVVENRRLMRRAFPDLFEGIGVMPVEDYGLRLRQAMAEVAPAGIADPQVVLLSPGIYNAAYFEHIFLAREMGVTLVEGRDLEVREDRVFMKTTAGFEPVHVIYRRLNDDFLDPEAFNPASMLGVPGLFRAYRKGNVALANAIGTGIADDKAVYAYMPRIIRYYLGEDAVIPNVETRICREPDGLAYTLDHLGELVVKPVGESGGYGIVIGPRSSAAELEACRAKLKADPGNFISQPMVRLSVCPTLAGEGVRPRHVDLRPFAVTGKDTWVLPGGLTRVALREGSLIVNSSQGGGSKDTWVLV
jgi:uncharacterized circularly permuted ATP-grasp superfamily protein